jgi:hypothetical protein
MVDIATLAFNIDSSQAKTAQRDLDRLGGSAGKAEGDVRKASQSIEQRLRGTARSVGRATAIMGAAVTAVGTGIALAIRGQINAADELAKMSARIGVPVEALSQLEHAANLSGTSMAALENGFRRLSMEMIQNADKFTELGVAVRDADGNMRAVEDVFMDVSDVLAQMPEGAERTATAIDLMGRSATDLIPMMAQGSDAIRDMMLEADRLGLTLTGETAAAAEAFNDNLQRLRSTGTGLWRMLSAELLPVLQGLTERALDLVNRFSNLSPEMRRFAGIAAGIIVALGPLLLIISSVAFALSAISAPVLVAIGGFAALTAAAAWLAASWDDLKARFPILENLADIGARLKEAWDNLPAIKWAVLIPALKWAAFIPGIRWAAFIPKLTWAGIITTISWARFIPKIGWAILAGQFAWSLLIKRINWGDFLTKINWPDWIPEINWENLFGGGRGAARAAAKKVGEDVADGLAEGIATGSRRRGRPAAQGLANQVIEGAKETLQTRSPSRVFMGIGADVVEGLAIGIEDNTGRAMQAMYDLAAGLQEPIQGIADSINQSFSNAVQSLLAGTQSLKGAFRSFAQNIRGTLAQSITGAIFGGGGGMAQAGGLLGGGGGMGGILGSLGGIGSAFIGGATNAIGAFTGGIGTGFAAIGGQISAAMTGSFTAIAGAVGAVLGPLAIVGGLIKGIIGSTKTIDQGLRITVGEVDTLVETFRDQERRRLFGLIRSRRTSFSEAGADVADPVLEAIETIRSSVNALSDVIGLGADALEGFAAEFQVSLMGLSDDEAQAALAEEFAKISDAMAQTALASGGLIVEAEGAAQRLESLSVSLASVNGMMRFLDRTLFDISVQGAVAAENLVQLFGGLDNFQQAHQFYFENFFGEQEQLDLLMADLTRSFEAINEEVPESIEAYRALIEAQDLNSQASREMYAALLQLAPQFVDVVNRAEALNQSLGDVGGALSNLTDAAVAEVRRLQRQLLQLQGNVQAVRAMTLEDLQSDEARAIQREIFKLQDEQAASNERVARSAISASSSTNRMNDAMREAEAIAAERERLERRILALEGETVALRARELGDVNLLNQSLQTRIWNLEDEREIMREREGLETQLLRLQGNTAELRRRELESLDASNRGLQLAIWKLQDFNDAIRRLNENDFATLVDFNRASALEANRLQSSTKGLGIVDDVIFESGEMFSAATTGLTSAIDRLIEAMLDFSVSLRTSVQIPQESNVSAITRRLTPRQMFMRNGAQWWKSAGTAQGGGDVRGEVIELKEYVRELVKINHKQERTLKEIQIQGETA